MRLSLLLAPVVFLASSNWAGAQTPAANPVPKVTNDLPTVVKPAPDPKADPAVDPNAPAARPNDPRINKERLNAPAVTDPAPSADEAENAKANAPAEKGNKSRKRSEGGQQGGQQAAAAAAGAADSNAGPDYTGPAILSRGMSFVRPSLPANERFRPFVGINFYHDSGLTGKYQGPDAKVIDQSNTGGDISFGLSGQHYRRVDGFQLDYRGHYYQSKYSSQDHAVALGYSRILGRHLTVSLGESAGLYSNNFAVLNSTTTADTSIANTAISVTPNTETFDDKTYYTSSQADLTYQKNARLSFDIGASGFLVKRQTRNLISANGYQTRSDIAYRITKKTTIGPYYAYSRYYYDKTFGDSDIHTVGVNYSLALNKTLQFRARYGTSRLESRGLQTVILAPDAAQILGVTVGTQRYYSALYVPDFALDVIKSFRRSSLSLSYVRGVSPGNGVILTSQHNSTAVNYSFSGFRKYAINVGAGRDTLDGVSQILGNYRGYYGRVSMSRPLVRDVQAVLAYDYRRIDLSSNTYARNEYRISAGFSFAPGPSPLKFW